MAIDWSDVLDATFQRGPEGSWWFCLTGTAFPVPVQTSTDQATRRIAENLLWFGTPFAINLALCHGVTAQSPRHSPWARSGWPPSTRR
jgi:hypothetical protein